MKKIVSYGLLCILFVMEVAFLHAQKKSKNSLRLIRMEVASGNTDNFHMVPMGANGLLVFYETNQLNQEGKRLWYFALFDIHLKQKWLRPVPLTDRLYFVKQKQQSNTVYFLFRNTPKVKKSAGFYDVLVYDIKKQSFRSVQGTMPLKAEIADFAVSGNGLAMGLNLENNKADALFVNTLTGAIKVVHITEPEAVSFDGLFTNPSNGTLVAVVNSTDAKSSVHNAVYSFRPDGTQVQKVAVSFFDPMSRLGEFVLAEASGNDLKFFGATHLMAKGGLFGGGKDEDHPDTEGVFYLSIKNGKQEKLRRFNFMDFKNIPGTFMQGAYQRAKGQKKTPVKQNTTVSLLHITHPVVAPVADGFLLSADA
ncbi:MAG TPA: hypothetical protein ENJ69_04430, partial [Bacteroidetes bacterium]|nr:hypothetical protein [Bacteroidota bacterium]